MRERQLRHDVDVLVDVEQLVAQRGEHDAADVGAGQCRIEHVRVLGQTNSQRRLRHDHRTGQENGHNCYTDETKPLHEIALPGWRICAYQSCILASNARNRLRRLAENFGPAAGAGGEEKTMSCHRWQAVACPSSPAASSGRERLQTSCAWAQRGCRWQPGGGMSALGGSPGRMRRCRRSLVDSTGTADSRAWA